MQEDKNCKQWDKPYYFVGEAAAFWCQIYNRNIVIESNGLPAHDPQNPCLRSRAEWIMDAIDCGELPCGRDGGLSIDDHVARHRRTVRRTDLRQWFIDHQGERPAFLFDEIERNVHKSINPDSFRALQADLQAEKARHERTKEQLRDMAGNMSNLEHERDALKGLCEKLTKQDKLDSDPDERSKKTFLHIIGALLSIIMDTNLYKSEESLRDHISTQYQGFAGCTPRTMAEKFSEAKKLLSE